MNKTATQVLMERDYRADLRRARAQQLAHAALQKLEPVIARENWQKVFYELLDLFMSEGIEIVTDAYRAELGLAPRDEKGWTRAEALALEAARLAVLMPSTIRPIPAAAPAAPHKD